MINWMTGILNSFSTPVTNGFTEGCNNKIKVLKRNAYGYQNFNRFRNRILHMFSYKQLDNIKQATAFQPSLVYIYYFILFGFTPTIDTEPSLNSLQLSFNAYATVTST